MILTDKEIRKLTINFEEAGLGKPLIENFLESSLEGASYDISMSNMIHTIKKGKVIDLKNQSSIEECYEEFLIGDEGYIMSPGEYILVGIEEGINLPDNLICQVIPKTKLTRAGLLLSAQYCNPSYNGYLQLGLKNVNTNPIIIYPKMKIGQYLFSELISKPTEEKLYRNKKNASYNNEIKDEFRGAKFDKELTDKAIAAFSKIFSKKSGEDLDE